MLQDSTYCIYLCFYLHHWHMLFSAFNLDSSEASVACGHGAEVKDDLLSSSFNGTGIAYRALTELSDFQSSCLPQQGLIWSLRASKEYFTQKIFLHFYILYHSSITINEFGV